MRPRLSVVALVVTVVGCMPSATPRTPSTTPSTTIAASIPAPATPAAVASPRVEHLDGTAPHLVGEPIEISELTGRILTDDFEDVFAFDVDGSNVVTIAGEPGAEFDAAWSPDGEWVVYRDSTRGINNDDEIFTARADGSDRRNITNNPANDWGPDWSPDGSTIAFNSDRDGRLAGFLMNPDGSNVRRIDEDMWFEYPSWSPDGTQIAFESAQGNSYDIFVLDLASGEITRLTDAPGNDSWPAWSPDGSTIAFSSHRDDCRIAPRDHACWLSDEPNDEHTDVWLVAPDGSNLRRATPEAGQFVAWSPDGAYLLVSGRALYVLRPDGSGRLELRAEGYPLALGGIPDWR